METSYGFGGTPRSGLPLPNFSSISFVHSHNFFLLLLLECRIPTVGAHRVIKSAKQCVRRCPEEEVLNVFFVVWW